MNKHPDDPEELDERLDEALDESYPASDPPAVHDIEEVDEVRASGSKKKKLFGISPL